MIRYALACDAGHRFESWFGDSAAFDGLAEKGLVTCPRCGSTHVGKTIMAPAVTRSASPAPRGGGGRDAGEQPTLPAPPADAPQPPEASGGSSGASSGGSSGALADDGGRELRGLLRLMRSKVLASTQDVGAGFPAEVRRMHDGDIPHRHIRGEATLDEARALLEDGIMVLPVPGDPGELN